MPAKDIYYDAVKNALIKDQWEITDDPLILSIGRLLLRRKIVKLLVFMDAVDRYYSIIYPLLKEYADLPYRWRSSQVRTVVYGNLSSG